MKIKEKLQNNFTKVIKNTSKAEKFFSSEQKQAISSTIKKMEEKSSGEIAVMVVDESSDYSPLENLSLGYYAAILGLISEILLSFLWQIHLHWSFSSNVFLPYWEVISKDTILHVSLWRFWAVTLIWYLFLRTVIYHREAWRFKLISRFIRPSQIEAQVRERAIAAFYEHQIYKTKNETGVLIFISLLEHKVWILGDYGINKKIGIEFWHACATELAEEIGKHNATQAVCRIIEKCGAILATYFPKQDKDTNEVKDEVIT